MKSGSHPWRRVRSQQGASVKVGGGGYHLQKLSSAGHLVLERAEAGFPGSSFSGLLIRYLLRVSAVAWLTDPCQCLYLCHLLVRLQPSSYRWRAPPQNWMELTPVSSQDGVPSTARGEHTDCSVLASQACQCSLYPKARVRTTRCV